MHLSSKDHRFLLKIIEMVYSISQHPLMMIEVFKTLEKQITFKSAVFIPQHERTGRFMPDEALGYHLAEEEMQFFCSDIGCHPFCERGLHLTTVNRPLRFSNLKTHCRAKGLPTFRELNAVSYELCMALGHKGSRIATIFIRRRQIDGDFTGAEKAIVSYLLPHLSRALRLHQDRAALKQHPKNAAAENNDSDLDIPKKISAFGLTGRQIEIAALVIKGLTNREIAGHLFISELTVKDHLSNIYRKMAVRHRCGLISKVVCGNSLP